MVQGKISRQLQQQVARQYPGYRTSADAYLQYGPLAVSLGLGAAGVKGRYPFREQVLLAVLSNVAALGVTYAIKQIARYPRPDGSGYDAFPSGHATRAFTAATLLHKEYGPRSAWYSVGGYGVATATGTLRVLENQHWLSDVLAGAAVGIGATEVVYMGYPWVKEKLKKKKR
ncbi:hypothetical protein GCM10027275_03060 [Rhabdobacter roseus]